MSKIIVLMGAPGAGKGTQARLLQERQNIPQISTGDILRVMKEERTPLAEEVKSIMNSGQLVPDALMISVVRERTSREDCKNGYILDGFPRTAGQAAMLEKLADEQGNRILPISIDVPFEVLEKRMTGRWSCPVCGEIYNIYFKPPKFDNVCDLHPEAQLSRRSDDTSEKAKIRLETYERETRPLLDYYAASNRLQSVDGTRDPEAIYAEIEKIVNSEKGKVKS
ncbi:MAG TPA: adenylate kinase [Pyrinomonadaceae bacterium]